MDFNEMLRDLTGNKEEMEKEKTIEKLENDEMYNRGIFSGLKYQSLKMLQEYIDDKLDILEREKTEFNEGQMTAYNDIKSRIEDMVYSIDEWLENLNQEKYKIKK